MSTTKRASTRKILNKRNIVSVKSKTSERLALDFPESQTWANWQLISEHWQSDLKFFADEIRFLHNLISKYFVWLMEEENIVKTRSIARELSALELKRQKHEQAVIRHQQHYRSLVENPFSQDSQKFKKEHAALESEIAAFTTRFKKLKRDTFELTEHVLESEKVKHLLGKNQFQEG
jgi:hypothetical protein